MVKSTNRYDVSIAESPETRGMKVNFSTAPSMASGCRGEGRAEDQSRAEKNAKNTRKYGTCMGHVWEIYGKYMGHVWDMYGKYMGNIWEMDGKWMGNIWEIYGKWMGNGWEIDRKYVGNGWEIICIISI